MTTEQLKFSQDVQDRLDSISNIADQCITALQSQRSQLSELVEDVDAESVSLTQAATDVLGSGEGTAGQVVLEKLNGLTSQMQTVYDGFYNGVKDLEEIKESVTADTPIGFGR